MSIDDAEQMISDCENRDRWLTEWEQEFLTSLRQRVASGRESSERQDEILNRIWNKVTSRG